MESTYQVSTISDTAASSAEAGLKRTEETKVQMDFIHTEVEQSADLMRTLLAKIDEMEHVLGFISTIAAQTNDLVMPCITRFFIYSSILISESSYICAVRHSMRAREGTMRN